MGSFWSRWHREIIRGATLFAVVIAIGIFAHYLVARVRAHVETDLPAALQELRNDLNGGDVPAGPRTVATRWQYGTKLAPKQWVWVHTNVGSITVGPGKSDSLEVTAVKTYHRSDASRVRFAATPYPGGVAICAVWSGSEANCGPGDEVKLGSIRHSDVAVDFTVRLPRGVALGATTVTGGVHVSGASAPIVARTVNGEIDAETAAGPVRAHSVNGNVRVRIRGFADTGAVDLVTVNGSATAELPPRVNAAVQATTVNGAIYTDFPLSVSGKFVSHKLEGTLGDGGRDVKIVTVNGSISLKKAL